MHQAAHENVSHSFWTFGSAYGLPSKPQEFTSSDFNVDVCVIGAGIAGLTTAYLCARLGLRVVLVEAETVGSGETLRTTGHLAGALDGRIDKIEAAHGPEKAALLRASHAAAVDWIEDFCAAHAPLAEFRRIPAYLYASPETENPARLLDEACAAASRAGQDASVVRVPLFGSGAQVAAVRFENQAEFDIGAYMAALTTAYIRVGGTLWEHTHVLGVEEDEPRCRVAIEGGGIVRARNVMVATNVPMTSWVSLPLRQAAYRSYVLGFEIPSGTVLSGLHWDTASPYHYVRSAAWSDMNDILLVGGEDHRTGKSNDAELRLARLEGWTREHFPSAMNCRFRWSGQILEPFDGIGFVGRSQGHKRVYVITGDAGHGLTLGTLGAKILADYLSGTENPYADLYAPSRSLARGISRLIDENATSMSAYFDYARPSEVRAASELPLGLGGVLRAGLELRAVSRDKNGGIHEHSAVCPHLGAIVHWNALEQSWDCPCHGSRFDSSGFVITGPATTSLGDALVDEAEI